MIPERYRLIAETFYRVSDSSLDFSEQALVEAYEKETHGIKHDMSKNGFAFGKKAFDITIAAWKEDLEDGLFCKYDYLRDYPEDSFEYEFIWSIIRNFVMTPLFAHDRQDCSL